MTIKKGVKQHFFFVMRWSLDSPPFLMSFCNIHFTKCFYEWILTRWRHIKGLKYEKRHVTSHQHVGCLFTNFTDSFIPFFLFSFTWKTHSYLQTSNTVYEIVSDMSSRQDALEERLSGLEDKLQTLQVSGSKINKVNIQADSFAHFLEQTFIWNESIINWDWILN